MKRALSGFKKQWLSVALAGFAALIPVAASAGTVDWNVSGYFLGGSQAPFPLSPATIKVSLTYDPAGTSPSDANYGISGWYFGSITSFKFQTTGAVTDISGSYTGSGAGMFVVFNNNGGLDALAPSVFASQGLTGVAPSGWVLESAGLYFADDRRLLGSSLLPPTYQDAHLGDFILDSMSPSGSHASLFDATFMPIGGTLDQEVTIYASINAAPEISTWAMMIAGLFGLGLVGMGRARNSVRVASR